MNNELTFFMIKPDAVTQRAVGLCIREVEVAGFRIEAMKCLLWFDRSEVDRFYAEHRGKDFYETHARFMCSGPVIGLELRRDDAVAKLREIVGATNPREAAHGTLRRSFGTDLPRNAVHASDSVDAAIREARIFFKREG